MTRHETGQRGEARIYHYTLGVDGEAARHILHNKYQLTTEARARVYERKLPERNRDSFRWPFVVVPAGAPGAGATESSCARRDMLANALGAAASRPIRLVDSGLRDSCGGISFVGLGVPRRYRGCDVSMLLVLRNGRPAMGTDVGRLRGEGG